MIIYLCIKSESKILIFSKDIEQKPFFKVENFSKLKKAITPNIIGGIYPKSNLTYSKAQVKEPIFFFFFFFISRTNFTICDFLSSGLE